MNVTPLEQLFPCLYPGEFVSFNEETSQVEVGNDASFRGKLQTVVRKLNEFFVSKPEIWLAAFEGRSDAAPILLRNLKLLNEKVTRHNTWCRRLSDWVNSLLSFFTGIQYERNCWDLIRMDCAYTYHAIRQNLQITITL